MTYIDGMTYMHEHTTIDLSRLKGIEDTNLNCFDQTVAEFKGLYARGVRNIVDVTNLDMRRNPTYVAAVAQASGLNIIQSTGFYQDKFQPYWVKEATVDQLATFMRREILDGIAATAIKAQLIGEIGTSKDCMTANERKVFLAASQVQKDLGVPLSTHTTLGTYGQEQVAFFKDQGVNLERVIIGHVDLTGDLDYILHLLDQGVGVAFDTVGKNNYQPDALRVAMLKGIEKRGYQDQVFLSMDITRRSHLTYQGGLGYAYLLDTFVPMLREAGLSDGFIDKMLIHNPKRFLTAYQQG